MGECGAWLWRMLRHAAQATLPRHVCQGPTGPGQSWQVSGLPQACPAPEAAPACPHQDNGDLAHGGDERGSVGSTVSQVREDMSKVGHTPAPAGSVFIFEVNMEGTYGGRRSGVLRGAELTARPQSPLNWSVG